MTDSLRDYQIGAINELRAAIRDGHKRIMLYSPTGSGKTEIGISVIRSAAGKDKCVGFICNRISLVHQASKRFAKSKIQHGILQGQNSCYTRSNVLVCSIKTLAKRGYPQFDLMVIDEAHGCTAQEYVKLLQTYNNIPVIGLSATPFTRGLGQQHEWGKLFDKLVCAITIRELIDLGFLVDCDIYAPSEPDLKGVKIVRGDYDEKQLGIAMDKAPLIGDIFEHWKKLAFGLQTVVFATSIAHSKHIVESFIENGITAEHIDCYSTDDERRDIMTRYEAGETKIISNVSVLAEGWDCLDQQTEILTPHGWKGMGAVAIGDAIYSMNRTTEEIEISKIENYAERNLNDNEKMVQFKSQHVDIRTTEGHEFHIKTGRNTNGFFETKKASDLLAQKTGSFSIPLCGEIDFPGVCLTNDELKFIAWFMTDGGFVGKTKHTISITQSQAKPFYVNEIRSLLKRLGLDFRERIREHGAGAYANGKPYHEFSIPKGNTGGQHKRSGWFRFLPYLDKMVSPRLHDMTKEQFILFWDEMLKGDGEHQKNKSGWLWCCEKSQADAYTQMAVLRGFTASYSTRLTPNGVMMYRICVRNKQWITMSRSDSRAVKIFNSDVLPTEKVWCVKNKNSTLITRRNGKISIIGNCPSTSCMILARPTRSLTRWIQMVGRALRPFHGKDRAIILDHSGTCHRLGYPTDDLPLELNDGRKSENEKTDNVITEKLPRKCPHCHFMIPAGTGLCPKCGTKLQKQDKTKHAEGELKKVDRKPVYTYEQKQMLWSESLGLMEQRKKSPGWASHLYKSLTGVWPSGLQDHPSTPSQAVINMAKHNAIKFAHSQKNKTK